MRDGTFRSPKIFGLLLLALSMGTNAFAQGRAGRPPLFFHEEWKQTPAGGEHPVTQDGLANASLELKLYGTSGKEVQLTGSAKDETRYFERNAYRPGQTGVGATLGSVGAFQ